VFLEILGGVKLKRKLFAVFILFLLLIGYLAYLNSLPPAVRAYKMARIA
jgi:hypothetical protein